MRILLKELPKLAKKVIEKLPGHPNRASLLFLQGELGAGKTTFVQVLARELGVSEPAVSPTYVLMKKYQTTSSTFKTLVHIDLYRLEKPEELAALKLEKVFADPGNLVCIEWPERAEGVLPQADMTLQFSSDGASAEERYIDVQ